MMGSMLKKAAAVVLAGSVVWCGSVTALAAEGPGAPKAAQEQKQGGKAQEVRKVRETLKELTERIAGQRAELKGKLQEIRSLVQTLKQDEKKNRVPLEKAKAELRELKLLNGDRKALNARLKEAHAELKAALEARDAEAAKQAAERLVSLKLTKLELLQDANQLASQTIAHLKAAIGQE